MKLEELNKELPQNEMCEIAKGTKTDKVTHGYTRVYHEIMKKDRDKEIDFFELGIFLGNSLKLWYNYFKKGNIYAIDNGRISKVNSFSWIDNDRITCSKADQREISDLKKAFEHFGCDKFDYILDDAHHFQEHQQKSIALLFPTVKPGGYYIIEDVIDREDMLTGSQWGAVKEDCTDATDHIFEQFMAGKELKSDYMTDEQIEYIVSNIDDIYLYNKCNKDNSPINGTSKLLVIKKK